MSRFRHIQSRAAAVSQCSAEHSAAQSKAQSSLPVSSGLFYIVYTKKRGCIRQRKRLDEWESTNVHIRSNGQVCLKGGKEVEQLTVRLNERHVLGHKPIECIVVTKEEE